MEHADISAPIHLYPGQALRLHAVAGTAILVTGGCLRLEESPLWLCGGMVRQATRLRDGEHHLLERDGWIALQAEETAGLILAVPRAQRNRLGRAWRSLAALLERLRIRRAPLRG